ncbi:MULTISPECIES: transposase family protein [unclassified Streptomyces]|uniref:transposase family protein n=1 Tax=unclassified Streptomyces TaxID=2593676 RepID=UPI0027E55B08|nr:MULTISPECIES: transposase family protein [unclassified Streptomyces]
MGRQHLGELLDELELRWQSRCESGRHERRGGSRRRQTGAGPKYVFTFRDRLIVTLVHLRTGLTQEALAVAYDVGSSTVSRAINELRPVLAGRGFAVPDRPGLRLRTLEDVFAYAQAEGIELRLDGAETQVRRPQPGRPGRRAFVSGKRRQNTIKTTTFSDGQGRLLFSGVERPGRMHDQTAVRTEGIAEQFRRYPDVKAKVDSGYAGLAKEFPDQVTAPPKKPKDDAPEGDKRAWRGQTAAVLGPDLHRARQRRATAVGAHAPLHRTTRDLPADPARDRRPDLRPSRQTPHPPRPQHRTGARPRHSLLITHQPNHQASMPADQSRARP